MGNSLKPFLRWAGGKRWLSRSLAPLIAARLGEDGTYVEPFLGSGAMFFAIQPKRAVLSDLNEDLMTTFREVAANPQAIIDRLLELDVSQERYRAIRDWSPSSRLDRATRFIYLNRSCYGGLYRENRNGVFNVPFGGGERNHKGICGDGTILDASKALARSDSQLVTCDFEDTLANASENDVVYCDPTYREITRKQFDRYGRNIFGWADQERLAKASLEAAERGAVVILSNSTCSGVRALYRDSAAIAVKRRKGLGTAYNSCVEYIFVLDPRSEWASWQSLGLASDSGSAEPEPGRLLESDLTP